MKQLILLLYLLFSSASAQISGEAFGVFFPQSSAFSIRASLDYTLQLPEAREAKFGLFYIAPLNTPSALSIYAQLETPIIAAFKLGARIGYSFNEIGVSTTGRLSGQIYGKYTFINKDDLALSATLRLEPNFEKSFFFNNFLSINGRWRIVDVFTLYFALEQEIIFIPKLEYGGLYTYIGGVWRVTPYALVLVEWDTRWDDFRIVDAYAGIRVPLPNNWAIQTNAGIFQTTGKAIVWIIKFGVVYNR